MPHKRKDLNLSGANLWYLVGLIVTDGSLSIDGRHINITAKDSKFLHSVKNAIGITNRIGVKNKAAINESHQLEFSNKNLYEFLLSIGLTPRKSLDQNEVLVDDDYFHDFLRGVIDGDGSIRSWAHSSNKCEQWSLRIYSGSVRFLEWLQKEIEQFLRVKGRMHRYKKEWPLSDLYVLKYGKLAAQTILSKCYYQNALSLDRKDKLAAACCHSSTGWNKSKTVLALG